MKLVLNKKFIGALIIGLLMPLVFAYGGGASITDTIGTVGDQSGLPSNSVSSLLLTTLLWLLRIFTILAILAFIIAGVMFLLAGSNKNLAEKAKSAVGYSILGIIVALSAYIIIILIDDLLWGTPDGGAGPTGGGFF